LKIQNTTQGKDLENGVILIILNDDETEDATSLSEENKDEMLVMIERDIQESKKNERFAECVHIQLY
jgi:hypothetical protein